jgi:hypothetical protein
MSDGPTAPRFRPDPCLAAAIVPAIGLALVGPDPVGLLAALAGLTALLLLLEWPRLKPARGGRLGVLLLLVGLPTAVAPNAPVPILLVGAGALGLLAWLGRSAGDRGAAGRWAVGLLVPSLGFVLAAVFAFAAPRAAGGPGIAALFLVAALVVAGLLLAGGGEERLAPAGPDESRSSG